MDLSECRPVPSAFELANQLQKWLKTPQGEQNKPNVCNASWYLHTTVQESNLIMETQMKSDKTSNIPHQFSALDIQLSIFVRFSIKIHFIWNGSFPPLELHGCSAGKTSNNLICTCWFDVWRVITHYFTPTVFLFLCHYSPLHLCMKQIIYVWKYI